MLHAIVPVLTLALAGLPSSAASSAIVPQEAGAQATATVSEDAAGKTALEQIDAFIAAEKKSGKIDMEKPDWKLSMPFPPELKFDPTKHYFWNVKTSKGDIKIRLMPDVAPMHVSSTIYLVRAGFYDDLIFHRVITGFMAQGGCPIARGSGNPGYQYDGETDPEVTHNRPGLLSMANTKRPGSDGSQFFLTFVPTPHLNGKHTIFGEVVDGMPVVKALEAQGSPGGTPKERLEMISSTISVAPKPAKAEAQAPATEEPK